MALFSRMKSKAKRASKEEEKKAAADAKAAAQPVKTPQRGRNGKIIAPATTVPEQVVQDIPAPSQLPRHFHSPMTPGRGRIYSYEDHSHTESDKPSYFDPHSSGDSGYASPGAESRVHSRGPNTQQSRRDQDYLPVSNKSTPQLTLGEELAQEPAFAEQSNGGSHYHHSEKVLKPSKSLQTMRQETDTDQFGPLPTPPSYQHSYQDGRQQRLIQQSMPMRPTSVPAQALQPRHQRVSHPPPQHSSSPGPVLQNAHPALSPRSRASVPLTTGRAFDWESPSNRDHRLPQSSFQPQSPTSPDAQTENSNNDHDDVSPSLNILNGLKVNRRGLILDEEGDPIGELFEGDILDCVRQKADAYGDVLDEYGRVVGRVRTLSIKSPGTSLHRSNTNASKVEHYRSASPAPPVPALSSARDSHRFIEGQHGRTMSHDAAQKDDPSSLTRALSIPRRHNNSEDEGHMYTRQHDLRVSEVSQQNINELAEQNQLSTTRNSAHESSTCRSESSPSVPESRSTAEIALSDDGTATSDESHLPSNVRDSGPMADDLGRDHVASRQVNATSVEDATVNQPQVAIDGYEAKQSIAGARERAQPAQVYTTTPSISRSVSERALPIDRLPPVPALPKSYLEIKKAAHAQAVGQLATPNRVKTPLPAFPGRGLSVGIAGGSFGNGPMPGLPNRRLTTPAFSSSPALGISGLNAQSPFAKPRTSTPLVRSPLSSHGKSCTLSGSTCS
jgi:hypothetical protein